MDNPHNGRLTIWRIGYVVLGFVDLSSELCSELFED